jgi:hypothetical protein
LCAAADHAACMQVMRQEIEELEAGVVLSLGEGQPSVFAHGGVALIVSDFPEGNRWADSLGHSAALFCRACDVPTDRASVGPRLSEQELRRRQQVLESVAGTPSLYAAMLCTADAVCSLRHAYTCALIPGVSRLQGQAREHVRHAAAGQPAQGAHHLQARADRLRPLS